MFFVYELGVEGRLKYVQFKTDLGMLADDGYIFGYRINVSPSRDLPGELGFLMAHTPGAVTGIAGECSDGQPWLAVIQYWLEDDESAARQARAQAIKLAGGFDIAVTSRHSISEVRDYYEDGIAQAEHQGDISIGSSPDQQACSVDYMLQGLGVELTGYSVAQLVANYSQNCAFPAVNHQCRDDVIDDVMTAWIEQRLDNMT